MPHKTIQSVALFVAIAMFSATILHAQPNTSFEISTTTATDNWQVAQSAASSKSKLFVITMDHPHRRQACRVQSFTIDKLVCSRGRGGSRTYDAKQVLALLVPGDDDLRLPLLFLFSASSGAAIWGTVVLAAACPACAVATGIAALILFCGAGAILIGDDASPVLYLAPGQKLSRKLGYIQR